MKSKRAPSPTVTKQLDESFAALRAAVDANLPGWLSVCSGPGLRDIEAEIAREAQSFADRVTGMVIRQRCEDESLRDATMAAARSAGSLKHGGRRSVEVRLLGGSTVRVEVDYLRVDRSRRPGRKRGVGKRGPNGAGFYPLLSALGVMMGATPAVATEILRQVADSDSVRSGRAALDRRGLDFGHKQTLRLVNGLGSRAVAHRNAWLESWASEPREMTSAVSAVTGKRLVVTLDGGRIRERVTLKGRPRTETGRHRYNAPWREPKLLTIYVVDGDGEVDPSFRPICDGTLGDCDVIFDMLLGYLRALGAQDAAQVIFVADGALWIWERTALLAQQVGIPWERVREVIDWYHATEKLGEVAKIPAKMSPAARDEWFERAKALLHEGDIDELMAAFDQLAVGRRAKRVNSHRDYFVKNRERMQYVAFEAAKLPCGSGAVESAVRRVINMRMKGNGTFWKHQNAESMLLLRGYLKAGRFDDLMAWLAAAEAKWWGPHKPLSSPIAEIAATRLTGLRNVA